MCGIAGIWHKYGNEHLYRDIKRMTDTIVHRGPDGEGHWIADNHAIALGHRRLSILDLSDQAKQPMKRHNLIITFNGEIYNYLELKKELELQGSLFYSASDTEVLLEAYAKWGVACLNKLDGMFAFAIFDETKGELFCARDRFGEKPFYYVNNDSFFAFGSEMKELFSLGIAKHVNEKMLFNYLTYDVVEDPKDKSTTFYSHIRQLAASHYMVVSKKGEINVGRYWDIDPEYQIEIAETEAKERFLELFDESLKRRMRSDVKVGSSLSGGVDSSSILGSVLTLFPDTSFNAFTARFDDKNYDEGQYIDLLKRHKQFNAHFCYPQHDQVVNELDTVFHHQEEPFGSTSIIAQWEVMKLAKTHDTIVLLDGQGADETMAGYYKYFLPFLQEVKTKSNRKFKQQLKTIETTLELNSFLSKPERLRLRSPLLFDTLSDITRSIRKSSIATDLSADFRNEFGKNPSPFHRDGNLNHFLYKDVFNYGLGKLLRFSDRNAMAHSREVRLPYLSHELVEFVFSLPSDLKMKNGWSKYILRCSMEERIPIEIAYRKDKKGFQAPASWMEQNEVVDLIQSSVSTLKGLGYVANPSASNAWQYIMAAKLFS